MPLGLAVAYSIYALASQTRDHSQLLMLVIALKDLEADIGQQINGLERAGLQFLLIGDPRFKSIYDQRMRSSK